MPTGRSIQNWASPGIEALFMALLSYCQENEESDTFHCHFIRKWLKPKPIAVHNQRKSLPNASFVSHTHTESRGPGANGRVYCHFHGSVERFHLPSCRWYPLARTLPILPTVPSGYESARRFGRLNVICMPVVLFSLQLLFLGLQTSEKKSGSGFWAVAPLLFAVVAMSSLNRKSSWVLCPARIVFLFSFFFLVLCSGIKGAGGPHMRCVVPACLRLSFGVLFSRLLFVCLPSMSTSFFPVSSLSCRVLGSNLIAVGTPHMSHFKNRPQPRLDFRLNWSVRRHTPTWRALSRSWRLFNFC